MVKTETEKKNTQLLVTLQLEQNLKKTRDRETQGGEEQHYIAPDNDIHLYNTLHRQERQHVMCTSH